MKCLSSAALVASLVLAGPAFAAMASSGAPAPATDTSTAASAQSPAPAAGASSTDTSQGAAPAPAAADARSAGVDTSVTIGMQVKDSTGATIGQITAVDPNAAGKKMATIKMGTQSFSIDAGSLAVQGGAATINETKAQIQQQLPKS